MPLQSEITTSRPVGLPGEAVDNMSAKSRLTMVNDAPRGAQVSTLLVTGASNSKKYTVTINGVDVSYTSDASATLAEIANGLALAINRSPLTNGSVRASSNGISLVTLTAQFGGQGFTLVEVDAQLTASAVSANTEAALLPVGRLVARGPLANGKLTVRPLSALSSQVTVLIPNPVNATIYLVEVNSGGQGYHAQYLSDGNATLQEIVEGLQAVLAGVLPSGLVATEDNVSLTITGSPGTAFTVVTGTNNAGGTIAVTNNLSALTSVELAIAGVSERDMTRELAQGSNLVSYPPGSACSIAWGRYWVECEAAITDVLAPVYVRVAANGALDKIGAVSPNPGAGLVKYSKAEWLSSGNGVAAIELTK